MNGLEAYVGGYAVARSVPGGVQIWLNTVTVLGLLSSLLLQLWVGAGLLGMMTSPGRMVSNNGLAEFQAEAVAAWKASMNGFGKEMKLWHAA